MSTPRFGIFLQPSARDPEATLSHVVAAESAGLDFVSVQDHPYAPGVIDTFTLLAYVAARTSSIDLMTNVANLPLRPAPMLARAAAGIALLSGGRFDLGLGGGRAWDQIEAMGGPRWTPGETVSAVERAVGTLRVAWEHDAAVRHRIGIVLGAAGPRMLTVVGRYADGWVAPMATPFETKPEAQHRIDDAARSVGRDPGSVRRIIQLVGSVADDGPRSVAPPTQGPGSTPIDARPEAWAEVMAWFVREQRFDAVNIVPRHESLEQIARFGHEVVPRVRELVAGTER